jgi:xylobiose transport system permease protein
MWVVPAAVLFVGFGVLPIAGVVYLSFTSWNGLGDPVWIGGANWSAMLDDPDVANGLTKTAVLTALFWATQTPLALLLGVWSAGPQRGRAVLSAIFAVPLLLSTVAVTLTWLALFDPNFGLAAKFGKYVGVPDGNFLGDPNLALLAIVIVVGWQFVPFHALIYQAAARQISGTLYEAAALDGAGRVRQLFAITIPLLRDTIVSSSIVVIVGSLTFFESVLLLTGGGPGTATRILPLHMYIKGFVGFDMGYASSVAVLLVVMGTILSVLIVRVSGYQRMASRAEGQ